MSIARALTNRRGKPSPTDLGSAPQRSFTTSKGHIHTGSIRSKISAPMELTHTTNMLAYNAPDLYPKSDSSSPRGSIKTDDDSSDSPSITGSSPPTSPDIMSTNDRSVSPEPNHLSCYFAAPGQKVSLPPNEAPIIPKRAPSHTKKASFDNMASKYSRFSNQSHSTVSTQDGMVLSRSSSTSTNATTVSSGSYARKLSNPPAPTASNTPLSPPPSRPSFRRPTEQSEAQHPFGKELAQVTELAEELGVREKVNEIDEEVLQLVSKGLCRFQADDYLAEVDGLYSDFMRPEPANALVSWI